MDFDANSFSGEWTPRHTKREGQYIENLASGQIPSYRQLEGSIIMPLESRSYERQIQTVQIQGQGEGRQSRAH